MTLQRRPCLGLRNTSAERRRSCTDDHPVWSSGPELPKWNCRMRGVWVCAAKRPRPSSLPSTRSAVRVVLDADLRHHDGPAHGPSIEELCVCRRGCRAHVRDDIAELSNAVQRIPRRTSLDFSSKVIAVELCDGLGCGVGCAVAGRAWVVPCRRVGRASQGRWVFHVGRSGGGGFYPKAVRMRFQAVAIRAAHRQVASMRSRRWRALRVMRAATCRTR